MVDKEVGQEECKVQNQFLSGVARGCVRLLDILQYLESNRRGRYRYILVVGGTMRLIDVMTMENNT